MKTEAVTKVLGSKLPTTIAWPNSMSGSVASRRRPSMLADEERDPGRTMDRSRTFPTSGASGTTDRPRTHPGYADAGDRPDRRSEGRGGFPHQRPGSTYRNRPNHDDYDDKADHDDNHEAENDDVNRGCRIRWGTVSNGLVDGLLPSRTDGRRRDNPRRRGSHERRRVRDTVPSPHWSSRRSSADRGRSHRLRFPVRCLHGVLFGCDRLRTANHPDRATLSDVEDLKNVEVDLAFPDDQGRPWRFVGSIIRTWSDFDDVGSDCLILLGDARRIE